MVSSSSIELFQDCTSIHDNNDNESPWIFMTAYAVAATGLVIAVILVAVSHIASVRRNKGGSSTTTNQNTTHVRDERAVMEYSEEEPAQTPTETNVPPSPLRQAAPLQPVHEDETDSIDFLQLEQESVLSLYIEDSLTNDMYQQSLLGYNLQPSPSSSPPRPPAKKKDETIFCKQQEDHSIEEVTQNMTQSFDSEEKVEITTKASQKHHDRQLLLQQSIHTSLITLLAMYFVLHSSSFVLSGFDQVPDLVWQGTELVAASALFAVALINYTKLLNPINSKQRMVLVSRRSTCFWMCVVLILAGAVTTLLLFAPTMWMRFYSGLGHFAIALVAFFSICFGSKRNLQLLYLVDVFSMAFFIGGLVIRSSSWNCHGSLSSDLEADAVFNLCSLLSIFCFGCSQIAQVLLQGHHYSESTSTHTRPENPSTKKASPAVNTVLDQDFTIEV